jgi:hypothetical protein
MNDTGAQASTSAPVASSEDASSSTRAEQPEDIGDALGPSTPDEEHAVEHICFLAKHASTSTEVRLSVEDTIAELKAVSAWCFSIGSKSAELIRDLSRCCIQRLISPLRESRY